MPAPRRVSGRQTEILVEFAEANPNIALGRFPGGPQGARTSRQIWESLTLKLNSVAEGATKNVEQWRRYWIDFKAKSKAKAADARRRASGTGGGPNNFMPLSEMERRVLAIMGPVAVQGLSDVRLPIDSSVPTSNPDPDPVMVEEWLEDINLSTPGSSQASQNTTVQPHEAETYIVPEPMHENPATPLVRPQEIQTQRSATDQTTRTPRTTLPVRRQRPQRELRAVERTPSWALEIENRRIAAEERNAAAMESIVEVLRELKNQNQTRRDTAERIADSLVELVHTIKEIRRDVHNFISE